ncbi:hypothetical protein [Acidisphaera rubrifaciens]|uniref:Uncharacterized protein n=1 Tax=Acidisphaera rubrifaciens HS-AP3 TaxID=1231350 RepID=A0A0D6P939_9PROT|nr:hypothetical protein [Acidisphaera rubrifaciens]GAN78280.1 hypothetical protein Asru_0723_02 [Acidisphaera rubrifaciens HS-AP3]
MKNAELDKITASVEAAVRQAYALGRRDALDHVARWAQTEETTSTQLALTDANGHSATEEATAHPVPATTGPSASARAAAAAHSEAATRPRGFGALLRDYVYPTD